MPVSAVIATRQLRKRYRQVEALRGLDLEVPEGSICGFLGPNGAGKTTTMKILMGLIRPSEGWVSIFGTDGGGRGLGPRSRIGYLSQDPAFFPRATVRSVLRFAARRYVTGPRRAIDHAVDDTLGMVGLVDRADRKVKALSGGERQRLGIGQAVIGEPDLLILDEPSVGLDPQGRHDVLALLELLKSRMTIFYSSHILDDVERVADHVVIVDRGEVVEQGPMEQFLAGAARYPGRPRRQRGRRRSAPRRRALGDVDSAARQWLVGGRGRRSVGGRALPVATPGWRRRDEGHRTPTATGRPRIALPRSRGRGRAGWRRG